MYKEITGGQLVSLLIYQTSITADLDVRVNLKWVETSI